MLGKLVHAEVKGPNVQPLLGEPAMEEPKEERLKPKAQNSNGRCQATRQVLKGELGIEGPFW